MKTTVVCGLLGSGKTTFIRNFVTNRSEKTVVLVNDFGEAGIDGEIFSASGIESVELPSGCVCCTLKVDLITTIHRIVNQFSPEHLLIEPSGMASPSGVLEALESAGIGDPSVFGIVDAMEFTELYESGMYGSFFEDQIVNSDIIVVNKTDLADESEIVVAEELIASINPHAVLLRAVNAMIGIPLPDIARPLPPGVAGARGPKPERDDRVQPTQHMHLHFDTLSFRLGNSPARVAFTKFFDDLTRGLYGSVARAKALINTVEGPYRFDGTYGKVDRVRFEKGISDSRLVVIGKGLNKKELVQTIASLQRLDISFDCRSDKDSDHKSALYTG